MIILRRPRSWCSSRLSELVSVGLSTIPLKRRKTGWEDLRKGINSKNVVSQEPIGQSSFKLGMGLCY